MNYYIQMTNWLCQHLVDASWPTALLWPTSGLVARHLLLQVSFAFLQPSVTLCCTLLSFWVSSTLVVALTSTASSPGEFYMRFFFLCILNTLWAGRIVAFSEISSSSLLAVYELRTSFMIFLFPFSDKLAAFCCCCYIIMLFPFSVTAILIIVYLCLSGT